MDALSSVVAVPLSVIELSVFSKALSRCDVSCAAQRIVDQNRHILLVSMLQNVTGCKRTSEFLLNVNSFLPIILLSFVFFPLVWGPIIHFVNMKQNRMKEITISTKSGVKYVTWLEAAAVFQIKVWFYGV